MKERELYGYLKTLPKQITTGHGASDTKHYMAKAIPPKVIRQVIRPRMVVTASHRNASTAW